MDEMKPCPFCGGKIGLIEFDQDIYTMNIKYKCSGCGMEFSCTTDYAVSGRARAKLNATFFELWNRRANRLAVYLA